MFENIVNIIDNKLSSGNMQRKRQDSLLNKNKPKSTKLNQEDQDPKKQQKKKCC